MCGITGFWSNSERMQVDDARVTVRRMTDTLTHRGPDDQGIWIDEEVGICLGHRRLSVLDLSPQGHQPMSSADARYVIVYNGEIYNFMEMRRELEDSGEQFRGHSDTEVMLSSISRWGLVQALERFNGMFAFALWDRKERILHLGRDRMGEKPLYYGWLNKTFLFASELKALKIHPHFNTRINQDALKLYMQHLYVPAPFSIYEGIYKLPPGSLLTVYSNESVSQPRPYWSLRSAAQNGVLDPFKGSETDVIEEFEALLKDSVKMRMVADVPLGAFLSGGIDSSIVVALMQSVSNRPVKTFSIGVHNEEYNEAQYAKEVARHLETDHTELYVTSTEAMDVIPKLPSLYDEPFCDSSQIPTYLVCSLARQQVTVSLSGDGGDELFHGYDRYMTAPDIWRKIGWIPQEMRKAAGYALTCLSPQTWNRLGKLFHVLLPDKLSQFKLGDKIHKFSDILTVPDRETLYLYLTALFWLWEKSDVVARNRSNFSPSLMDRSEWKLFQDFRLNMMFLDAMTFLPDDILVKLDRASMGVSLESRLPLLDHRVVEFAWRVPLSMKLRNSQGKWLLRQVLYKYVPKHLIERPKKGFGVPIENWLCGPLRDWAEALLDERRLSSEGFFNPSPIRQKWADFLSGERNWHSDLWAILMFQAWLNGEKHHDSQTVMVS